MGRSILYIVLHAAQRQVRNEENIFFKQKVQFSLYVHSCINRERKKKDQNLNKKKQRLFIIDEEPLETAFN